MGDPAGLIRELIYAAPPRSTVINVVDAALDVATLILVYPAGKTRTPCRRALQMAANVALMNAPFLLLRHVFPRRSLWKQFINNSQSHPILP